MRVIPVLDLMKGHVVHAKSGQRQHYFPIKDSVISKHSDPTTVIQGFLNFFPFSHVYLADLDALMGQVPQTTAIHQLFSQYPEIEWWLDDGGRCVEPTLGKVMTVVGTESLDHHFDEKILTTGGIILSMDYQNGKLLGQYPSAWLEGVWQPDAVIHMNLDYVGTGTGPDWIGLQKLVENSAGVRIVASGGIRDAHDLARLEGMGVWGVLIASALHSGSLSAEEIHQYLVA